MDICNKTNSIAVIEFLNVFLFQLHRVMITKYKYILSILGLLLSMVVSAEESEGKRVMIAKDRFSVTVTHAGKKVDIKRNQDRSHQIDDAFRSTARGRIQPMHPFQPRQIETVGELEVLDYLEKRERGESVLLVDTRSAQAVKRGTIPGSINIHWKDFGKKKQLVRYFEDVLNVKRSSEGIWNYDISKTLVLFCNGPWCGQSSAAIKKLLRAGYPEHKIKYYRGGMQSWLSFGLTIVTPE
ncbi:rhodanese-like sulfurtransferase [Solemya velum gill symbiont]|uniref:Rhodanese-like sulfurtransferase n=2 Tax=Solemya velum gill symbiont TaxID=2340 RepID=A0A0B0H8J4_SOVGS|nr:rhodanese-like sulfurtransferase [Solemya velum gill symbiont]